MVRAYVPVGGGAGWRSLPAPPSDGSAQGRAAQPGL